MHATLLYEGILKMAAGEKLYIEFKHITWRVYVIKKSPTILHFKLNLGNKLINVTEVENKPALSHRANGYR